MELNLLTKKQIKMTQTFNDILATLENSKSLEVGNQAFTNGMVFDHDLSMSVFWDLNFSNFNFSKVNFSGSYFTDCKFENCTFEKTILRKCEFTDSTFKNCNVINSSLTKADFQETIFKNCEFKQVDFGWSYFANCQFLEIRLDDINFEGTIMSDLKAKNTTSSNLHFNEKFPMKFWKSNQSSEITDSLSFDKLLRDNDSD